MTLKQLFENDRGVSPVIGVILMVAITVILAAVIGTFVLDLGNNSVKQSPQAGVSWEDTGSTSATVTITSIQNADKIQIKCPSDTSFSELGSSQVGDTETCSGSSGKAIVKAQYQGNEAVISSHQI